jgi:hypothetical protein
MRLSVISVAVSNSLQFSSEPTEAGQHPQSSRMISAKVDNVHLHDTML